MSHGDTRLTYRELHRQATALARELQRLDVGPDDIVGLCVERSPLLVVGVLAILQAGAAYLPIDPRTPEDRIAFMLIDCRARLLLTERGLCAGLEVGEHIPECTIVRLARDDSRLRHTAAAQPERPFPTGSLAYVIYTSGSTGQPKGVLVPRTNVVALFDASHARFRFGPQDVWTLFHSFAFDFSVWEMFGALLYGGRLVVVPGEVGRNAEAFYELVSRERVTVLNQTPSAFGQFAAVDDFRRLSLQLRLVIFGGEALRFGELRGWFERHSDAHPEIVNMYGITETTVHVTHRAVVAAESIQSPGSLIGEALPHLTTYILDESLRVVADGATGELYVAGTGLSWGYLNRASLTASHFIASPFVPGERLYRSGDLVRRTAHGGMEYLGRIDQQVKLRGFRIELGEIEAVLLRHPGVQQAVVAKRTDGGEPRLVAYVVPVSASDLDTRAIDSIAQWRAIYQEAYETNEGDCSPSFVGWNCSYTGEPIPEEEMRQWLEATAERIIARRPQRILEIGCGIGLVLQRLAPYCETYFGTDLSPVAIARLEQWMRSAEGLPKVQLAAQPADDFAGLPRDFDTVVLNSVIQYFPGVHYLLDVLRRASEHLAPGGKIFVGDVRHYGLLEAFHASVQFAKADDDLTVERLRAMIDSGVRHEKELLVAPAFFHALPQWVPAIGGVEILLKRSDAHNELNQYRYDVWLHVGAPAVYAPASDAWRPDDDDLLRALDAHLSFQRPARVSVVDVPNARIEPALRLLGLMNDCDGGETWRTLRERAGRLPSPGVWPESLWRLGERHGYAVCVAWSETAPGRLNATFVDASVVAADDEPASLTSAVACDPQAFANDPLANAMRQAFVRSLREHLHQILPEHMLPSATVVLPMLPLTINGKVDKDRLPAPEARPDIVDYAEPNTDLQRALARIFAEVLRLDRVGLHDSFFGLGGHSLLAMRVIAQLRSELAVEMPLRALFDHPTVAKLEGDVMKRLDRPSPFAAPSLTRNPERGAIPLSFPQERLWFLEQLGTLGAAYHVPLAFRIKGPLDIDAVRSALSDLVERHEMLRTRFVVDGDAPQQVIDSPPANVLDIIDLGALAVASAELRIAELLDQEANHRHDLERGPLFRARLLRLRDDGYILILSAHHIVADGWSHGILFRELEMLYDARARAAPPLLPPPVLQYSDYAVWQRSWMQGAVLMDQLQYWKRQLAGAPELLALPTDRPRPAVASFRGTIHRFELTAKVTQRLAGFALEEGVTPFMVLLAAFQVLLARWSGGNDIVVGTPTAGRTHSETELLIGLFINTLTLRTRVEPQAGFRAILAQAKEVTLSAYAHQDVPFEKVVAELRPERDPSRQPVVQVMFALQNTGPAELQLAGAKVVRMVCPSSTSKYDLTLNVIESGDRIVAEIEYATDLFDATTVASVAGMYGALLDAAMECPDLAISRLRLVAAEAESQAPFAPIEGRTVCDLFEAQAARTPDAPAIESVSSRLTYAALDARANRLARALRRRGVRPGDLVAVVSDHDVETFVALLAVIKAGAAYLPIDVEAPPERLRHQFDDACPRLVLADAASLGCLPDSAGECIAFDACVGDVDEEACDDLHYAVPGPNDLAYVIYTSGSTGAPKGVLVGHDGLRELTLAQIDAFAIEPCSRLLQFASLSFDASVSEVFTAWCRGACLCLPGSVRMLAGDALATVLNERAITHVTLPPSVVPGLIDAGGAPALQTLVVAGEACSAAIVRGWPSAVRFINAYGPTEATVCATVHVCDAADPRDPPIGRPLAHATVYVLDDALQRVPDGIAGEIVIGGTGVARGYHRKPALTAERFPADPFFGGGARMYRTGDRGRIRADGVVEFLGRMDHQLKVRGYRIEPGDVETALLRDGRIAQAFVTAHGELETRSLIAYVVAAEPSGLSSESLLATVRERLPAYMVPSAIVILDRFPLTVNGKIDREALQAHGAASVERLRRAPVTARSPTELRLAAIWVEVLGCRQPGRQDSFFALGGHSLLATRAVGRIRRTMKVTITLQEFFSANTLESLAKVVDAARGRGATIAPPMPIPRTPRMQLSSLQQSLWMLDRLGSAGAAYNMPIALCARGRINVEALRRTLSELVRRHESLRTRFELDIDGPYCAIQPQQDVRMDVLDVGAMPAEARRVEVDRILDTEMRQRFNLREGNLLRAVLVTGDDESLLSLITHHIAADGWSVAILVNELRALYDAFAARRDSPLREPTLQSVDYGAWQRDRLNDPALEQQKQRSHDRLVGAPMILELPTDRPRPAVQSHRGALHRFRVPAGLHHSLAELSAELAATLYMTLLAAFSALLARLCGVEDLLIGSPLAVRTEANLEDLVGPLLNTVVVRSILEDDPTFAELLVRSRGATLDAYEDCELPFDHLVTRLQPKRDLARPPVVQVVFALQNYRAADAKLSDEGRSVLWEQVETPWAYAKYDLSLYIEETSNGLSCQFEYATDLFEAKTIERWGEHFLSVLGAAAADPATRISRLPLLGEANHRYPLQVWNDTALGGLDAPSIPEQIRRLALLEPNAIAVSCANRALTYADLDRCSSALASRLRQSGASLGQRVGICLDRTVDVVVAVLAVFKSGAAYVPLDPTYPQQRLDDMLQDSRISCVLTDRASATRMTGSIAPPLVLMLVDAEPLPSEHDDTHHAAWDVARSPDSIAYVIYTSGSTGRPKGCVVTDRGLLNVLTALADEFDVGADDRLLAVTPYSFDIAALELLMPLMRGARTHICPAEHSRDAHRLAQTIENVRPTIMQATPATWQMLFHVGWRNDSGMRLLCGGEALPDTLRERLLESGVAWNLYGPTETTIWSMVERIVRDSPTTIGRPIANTRIHVLDAAMTPVPIGVEGDLYIGGDGLARGYWNRPSLTAERFVADPFSVGGILYHTGDRAMRRADGCVVYLGRRDTQVKLRGYRIELGEIESVLAKHPGIALCACAVRRDGEAQIVAACVPAPSSQAMLDRRELQTFMRATLPEYMIPVEYLEVKALPLTANGKLDRNAIASLRTADVTPERMDEKTDEQAVQQRIPFRDYVRQLHAMWCSALGRHDIGLDEGFFEAGGSSLLAVTLAERIAAELQPGFVVTAIFEFGSIARIARYLESLAIHAEAFEPAPALRSRAQAAPDPVGMPAYYADSVAIVGMSCAFPGAKDHDEFWANLLQGKESIERISDAELCALGVPEHVRADPKYVPVRSALAERDLFDASFFNVSDRDAHLMDPQLRMLLMHAWRAIEDAGYCVDDVAQTAVFATASNSAYHARLVTSASAHSIEQYVGWIMAQNGTLPAVISNKLGLQGPSVFVHSNCSSSLTALDLAHRRLLEGEWRFALVAAARVASFEGTGYVHQDGMNFSSDGHLRAFDAAADGAVGGEGVAVLLLKRAQEAIADGDHVYALLRATSANNDGGDSAGFYAPRVGGQRAAIERALTAARIDPETISYVEAHGTGTPLGDPIEIAALSQAYGRFTDARGFCGIGSVKTNIGHLDAAAGMAGCIKVALSLSRGEIPATLHYRSPNPALKLEQSPFFVVDARQSWQGPRPYRAAVSSMGVGGSNAHAILEECILDEAAPHDAPGPWLFPLSAHDPECLRMLAEQLSVFVEKRPALPMNSLAYTLQIGRREMAHRLAIVAAGADELQARLQRWLDGSEDSAGIHCGHAPQANASDTHDPASAELERALARWASQGHFEKLAALWVTGFAFDWRALYATGAPRRLSVPTYPFLKHRFWLDPRTVAANPSAQIRHPTSLFVERWDCPAPARLHWDHQRILVLCGFPVDAPLVQAIVARAASASDCALRLLPHTDASVGERYVEYATALLDLMREVAPVAPVMIQLVLTGDEDGHVCGALTSLLLSAKREYDRLDVQTLHLTADTGPEAAIELLFNEPPFTARHVRDVGGVACTRRFVRLRDTNLPTNPPWREGGRYLVTGGSGRLGMIVARAIATTLHEGTIVLVGRSELSPDTSAHVAELRSLGLRVEYRRADVTDQAQAQLLLQTMTAQYGGIDGIVHTAGVLVDGYLARKLSSQLHAVLAPKVAGLELLDSCHGAAPLDFLLCFGSVGGVAGSAGQGDYAAANAFMRTFAERRNALVSRGLRQGRTLCIDWPYWREGGIRLTEQANADLLEAGLAPLETADGMAALSKAWDSGETCVTVWAGETGSFGDLLTSIDARVDGDSPKSPIAVTKDCSDGESLQIAQSTLLRLIAVFSDISMIDASRVNGYESLEAFNIDSIMIVQLNKRLATVFPGLSRTLFYQFATLAAIRDHLVSEHAEACRRWGAVDVEAGPLRALPAGDSATEARDTPTAEAAQTCARSGDAREPIAIVGLAGHYPSACDLDELWRNLRTSRDCIDTIPAQRWSLDGFFCEDSQTAVARRMSYSRWGGFLGGFAQFDPLFFGLSPAEALDMDPQERLFLQACWEALESGNYTRGKLARRHGGRVGVFAGITKTGFELHGRDLAARGDPATPYTSFASVANRVSYLLDLKGPSFPIDTMCSASLTAIHEACEHLLRDECELALAGGVNLYLHPSSYVGLCSQRMLSTDGRCRSFGAGATGFVPGEGVGVVLLKPLSQAQRDGDRIHGVILASGINHGGRTHGYTVPNPLAQRDLIRDTLARAGVDARDIGYVEAHGTGTEMGDPIEVEGLSQAFAASTPDTQFCALGSVKSNIGHLEAAAGVAGLTKVLLQFKHRELVPTLHSANVNPNIDWARTPFFLQHKVEPWKQPRRRDGSSVPRLATVSSFGAGGSNAFLVVRESPVPRPTPVSTGATVCAPAMPALFVLSARRADRLAEYASRLAGALEQNGFADDDLPAIAATLQLGREAMEHRLAFATITLADAIEVLRRYANGDVLSPGTHVGQRFRPAPGADPCSPIEDYVLTSRFDALLAAWVHGSMFEWSSLYTEVPALVSLPTYPFAEETYWPVVPFAQTSEPDRPQHITPASGATLLLTEWEEVDVRNSSSTEGSLLIVNGTAAQRRGWQAVSKMDMRCAIDWIELDAGGSEPLRQLLVDRRIAKVIWFVPTFPTTTFDSMLDTHSHAVEQCAVLMRAIVEAGGQGARIDLVAVTRQGQSAGSGDEKARLDPAHASVGGFLRSAAKEYRHGAIAVVDLATEETSAGDLLEPSIETLSSLRADAGRAKVYARRQGRWWQSRLTVVEVAEPRSIALKRGGVYVVVGGAGHVGQLITKYLVQVLGATVVWVGRRHAGEVQDALSAFDATRRPLYIQADAADLPALRRARAAVLAQFGRIDALLVATTHFSLASIASISSADLRAAFVAKVNPAISIAQAFDGDAIDGIVFFSSLVSYIGNPGQSHYAAACAWQDAFASVLSRHSGLPAKVMNWGYWTIDDPRRTQELNEIGIAFIDSASGGQALETLMSGPFEQLSFICTQRPLAVEGMNTRDAVLIERHGVRRILRTELGAGVAEATRVQETINNSLQDPFFLQEFVHATVARELCQELRMDLALLDDQAMFAEYGVDSITGLKVVRAINEALGIALPAPCLFDHPNLEKLTAHILNAHRDDVMRTQSTVAPPPSVSPAAMRFGSGVERAPLREPIAIIGMSGRFAQSDDCAELWDNLVAGRDLIEPATRWQGSSWHQEIGAPLCGHAGYVRDVDAFDPLFFRISRADAMYMDPQQRLCLEESWKALEMAGYVGTAIAGRKCGVYIGCSGEDYTQLITGELPDAAMHGSSTALLSSRIAYHLDMHGPAMTVDTACSSGLVAIHLACQALWLDDIELAIAGGVHVQCTNGFHVIGSRTGMLSPDGRCFAFDDRANGFVPADGVGMVVLKRLSAAVADGDHVLGVIAGSGINQDGTSNGLTAPNALAQEQLESEVYERFGIDATQIQMAEAHGTGTVLGDPIEVQALTRAFRRRTARTGYCAIGSVKSNLGHAAEAAGMAGLFKVLLSLKHRMIPPTLHVRNINPHIDFADSPFYINTSLRAWPAPEHGPRRAVLSAFGLSGTNAHLVIEEGAPVAAPTSESSSPWLVVLSARTPGQLCSAQRRLLAHLQCGHREERSADCMAISYTLLQGRQHFEHRWACVASTAGEIVAALNAALASPPAGDHGKPNARERDALDRDAARYVEAARRSQDRLSSLQQLGELFVRGARPEFAPLFDGKVRRIPLPTYPFARERFWLSESASRPSPVEAAPKATPAAGSAASDAIRELESFIGEFLERALVLHPGELRTDVDLHALGADSLVSMRLMREISHRYGVSLSGRELFEHPTICALAAHVDAKRAAQATDPARVVVHETKDRLDASLDAFAAGDLSLDAMERLIEADVRP